MFLSEHNLIFIRKPLLRFPYTYLILSIFIIFITTLISFYLSSISIDYLHKKEAQDVYLLNRLDFSINQVGSIQIIFNNVLLFFLSLLGYLTLGILNIVIVFYNSFVWGLFINDYINIYGLAKVISILYLYFGEIFSFLIINIISCYNGFLFYRKIRYKEETPTNRLKTIFVCMLLTITIISGIMEGGLKN